MAATTQKPPIAIRLRVNSIFQSSTVDTSTVEISLRLEARYYATLLNDCTFEEVRLNSWALPKSGCGQFANWYKPHEAHSTCCREVEVSMLIDVLKRYIEQQGYNENTYNSRSLVASFLQSEAEKRRQATLVAYVLPMMRVFDVLLNSLGTEVACRTEEVALTPKAR